MADAKSTIFPCPHCGSPDAPKLFSELDEFLAKWGGNEDLYLEDMIAELRTNGCTAVVCDMIAGGCGASGPWEPTADEAVIAWNLRTDHLYGSLWRRVERHGADEPGA